MRTGSGLFCCQGPSDRDNHEARRRLSKYYLPPFQGQRDRAQIAWEDTHDPQRPEPRTRAQPQTPPPYIAQTLLLTHSSLLHNPHLRTRALGDMKGLSDGKVATIPTPHLVFYIF